MNQRPTGVTILSILAFIGGAFGILGGLALLGLGAAFAGSGLGGLSVVFGIVILVLSALQLYIGYGFWTLKSSAWRLGIVVFGASVVIQLIELVLGYIEITGFVISLVIYGLIIYYLLTPGVKAAFGITGDLQTAIMGGGGGGSTPMPPPAPPASPPPPAPGPASPPPASTWTGPDTTPPSAESDEGEEGRT